ncbi:unnamed protein product, partial [Prorocentrum cordatum]
PPPPPPPAAPLAAMLGCQGQGGIHDFAVGAGLGPEAVAGLRRELLHGSGIARLRGAVPAALCAELRSLALGRGDDQPFDRWPGVRSKRIRDPLEWGGAPAAAVLNELAARLGPLLEDVLGPRAWITSVQALALYPTAASALSEADEARLVAGSLHSDYPYGEFKEGMDGLAAARPQDTSGWQFPEGGGGWQFPADFHQPRTLQFTLPLDDFTARRGATRLLPGSARIGCARGAGGEGSPGAGLQPLDDAAAAGGLGIRIPSP